MKKYKQGMDSGGNQADKDPNPEISRRRLLGYIVGGGALAAGIYYGIPELVKRDPQRMEQFLNNIMRQNNDPEVVENIHERVARYEKELEELVEDATPVRTFAELNSVRRNLRGNYKLVNDIVCPNGHNWEPIGSLEKPFTGTFNGQGYTIHDLRAEWPKRDYVGMFGSICGEVCKIS